VLASSCVASMRLLWFCKGTMGTGSRLAGGGHFHLSMMSGSRACSARSDRNPPPLPPKNSPPPDRQDQAVLVVASGRSCVNLSCCCRSSPGPHHHCHPAGNSPRAACDEGSAGWPLKGGEGAASVSHEDALVAYIAKPPQGLKRALYSSYRCCRFLQGGELVD
jgi:hypothetical protein